MCRPHLLWNSTCSLRVQWTFGLTVLANTSSPQSRKCLANTDNVWTYLYLWVQLFSNECNQNKGMLFHDQWEPAQVSQDCPYYFWAKLCWNSKRQWNFSHWLKLSSDDRSLISMVVNSSKSPDWALWCYLIWNAKTTDLFDSQAHILLVWRLLVFSFNKYGHEPAICTLCLLVFDGIISGPIYC